MNTESPEMAQSMLEQEWYQPQHSSNIWALGLLMLEVVGGIIPDEQWDLQNSDDYFKEMRKICSASSKQPATCQHLQYSVT